MVKREKPILGFSFNRRLCVWVRVSINFQITKIFKILMVTDIDIDFKVVSFLCVYMQKLRDRSRLVNRHVFTRVNQM